ncbi:hypothetical protein PG997_012897 [Apiospora hydei]|uniref:Uncharacterized protein n=1 Tax=Apiospora hydei TaxID=1337664 RepID=A0ABR1V4N1_9PEZI
MEAILNFRPTRLERAEGFLAAICMAVAATNPGPDPEFDAFFNQILRAKGLPPLPVEPTGEGELYDFLKYEPFGKARTILAVMAPASLCFVFLSPETKRAIVNRLGQVLFNQMKNTAFLFLRYWRPGNRPLVRGLPSGVLGLRAVPGYSRQQNPRFWMFFDIAACGPFSDLVMCGLYGPLWDFPRYACGSAQAFVTAAAATRLERALRG